jgi:hypothetical protein
MKTDIPGGKYIYCNDEAYSFQGLFISCTSYFDLTNGLHIGVEGQR